MRIFYVILFCLLMSSTRSSFLSVSHHGPHMSIAKSYFLPMKLACDDHLTREIVISGISLFKLKQTVEANHVYPGIHSESQAECKRTFHPMNGAYPAECLLSFIGRNIPSDAMVVVVYRCITAYDPQKQIVRTRSSDAGDVVLRCGFNGMIDIINIKINATDLHYEEKETIKQQCATKMFQAPQQNPGPKRSVFCTVSRQGRKGELSVKYQCLQAQKKTSGQNFYHITNEEEQLRHLYEPDTERKQKLRN